MKDIPKNCWVKKTEIKLFDKYTLISKTETVDESSFKVADNSTFYTVPKCFKG